MKTRTTRISLFLSVGAASLVALGATAQTTAPAQPEAPAAAPSQTAPQKLPYGVEDVLKLSRAQVSEDITLNYIKNSGTIYNLAPNDIVYLKNEGVSDKVINTMMEQRQNVPADVANQNALQAQAAVSAGAQPPPTPDPNAPPAAPVLVQPAPFYVQPTPVYVPPEPDYEPPSTLYVIPYGASGYGYLPPYPSFSFSSRCGYGSSVYYVGQGYGGRHFYNRGYYHGHGSTVYHFGHR
jgi:hypothetical protein